MTELFSIEGGDASSNSTTTDATMNMKQRPVLVAKATTTEHLVSSSSSSSNNVSMTLTERRPNTTTTILRHTNKNEKENGNGKVNVKRIERNNDDEVTINRQKQLVTANTNDEEISRTNTTSTTLDSTMNYHHYNNDREIAANVVNELNKQDTNNMMNNQFVPSIQWFDFIALLSLHIACVVGFILMFTTAKLLTTLWAFFLIYTSGFGITAGAHRLWSHRAYKAKWPLRLLLIFLFTITGQRDVYTWALDHRIHHKYSETDSDPHNAKRGFWFAHIGWLFTTPHPDVVQKRANVDMSDLIADPIVMWQKKYYFPLCLLLVVAMPTFIPWYYWNENILVAFLTGFAFRYCVTLNIAFFVNSVAHMWGNRPYDRYISPVENLAVSIAALGEGWHNYHHVFPWDYKTSELGAYTYNLSTGFIDFFAKIGWAYDRKKVSPNMIARRAARSGDGSHVWGYGDKDILREDLTELEQMNE